MPQHDYPWAETVQADDPDEPMPLFIRFALGLLGFVFVCGLIFAAGKLP